MDIPACPLMMPDSLWRILYARGFQTAEELNELYSPNLKKLRQPFCLKDMDKAVARLKTALENSEQVAVYADYDLDGSPGAVLMKTGLEALGFKKVIVRQPKRLSEGYGVHSHIVQQLKDQGVSLIVTVDVGITDVEAVAFANSQGIDVIVTDHHLPKDELPPALAIINPNRKECDSQLGYLSGTGVAFYVLMALKIHLENKDLELKNFLDLFALATITDMVPLVKENRALVKHGLNVLQNTQRPGLAVLLQNLDLTGKNLMSSDIGFKIAPKLNALSRLEEEIFPLDLMLADHTTAASLVDQVMALNLKRKALQAEVFADAIAQIEFAFKSEKSPGFVSAFSADYHPGVVSVVANQLTEKFKRPAFVGAMKKDGSIVGSARSPHQRFDLQEILQSAGHTLVKFGGHKLAAGFETHTENLESFKSSLADFFKQDTVENSAGEDFQYDGELRLEELSPSFMKWYLGLEPFGMGFEEPLFLLRGLQLTQIKELKAPHLRLTLKDGGRSIEAPWFSAAPNFPLREGSFIDVLARPAWNEWRGRRTLQLMINSARPA